MGSIAQPTGGGAPPPGWDQVIKMSGGNKEDLALSVAALVLASRGDDLSMSAALGIVNEFMPWVITRFERCDFATIGHNENPSSTLMRVISGTTSEGKRPINSFASEFFSAAVLRRLDMPSVPSRIVTAREARELPGRWVVKALAADRRLHFVQGSEIPRIADGDFVLVLEVADDVASLDFIRRRILNQMDSFGTGVFGQLYTKASLVEVDRAITEMLAQACGKKCESADDLFSGFHPTSAELGAIEHKARWDGPEFLRICAARTFLGVGFAHSANILVTRDARLISLDHASGNFESGEDLRMLFRWTAKGTRAFEILREIGTLTEDDIMAAIEEIPAHPACGDVSPLLPYFTKRLNDWKRLAGVGEFVAAKAV